MSKTNQQSNNANNSNTSNNDKDAVTKNSQQQDTPKNISNPTHNKEGKNISNGIKSNANENHKSNKQENTKNDGKTENNKQSRKNRINNNNSNNTANVVGNDKESFNQNKKFGKNLPQSEKSINQTSQSNFNLPKPKSNENNSKKKNKIAYNINITEKTRNDLENSRSYLFSIYSNSQIIEFLKSKNLFDLYNHILDTLNNKLTQKQNSQYTDDQVNNFIIELKREKTKLSINGNSNSPQSPLTSDSNDKTQQRFKKPESKISSKENLDSLVEDQKNNDIKDEKLNKNDYSNNKRNQDFNKNKKGYNNESRTYYNDKYNNSNKFKTEEKSFEKNNIASKDFFNVEEQNKKDSRIEKQNKKEGLNNDIKKNKYNNNSKPQEKLYVSPEKNQDQNERINNRFSRKDNNKVESGDNNSNQIQQETEIQEVNTSRHLLNEKENTSNNTPIKSEEKLIDENSSQNSNVLEKSLLENLANQREYTLYTQYPPIYQQQRGFYNFPITNQYYVDSPQVGLYRPQDYLKDTVSYLQIEVKELSTRVVQLENELKVYKDLLKTKLNI